MARRIAVEIAEAPQQMQAAGSDRYPILTDEMHVVDEVHVDGVVELMRQAPTGTLRTRTGVYTVRPQRTTTEDCLFALDGDLDPTTLEIDALEFEFGGTIFTVDTDALSVDEGSLRMKRPHRVTSTGRRGLELEPGAVRLRVEWNGEALELPVVEFAVDELVVDGFRVESTDLQRHPATVVLCQSGAPIEVPCEVSFGGHAAGAEALLRVHASDEDRPELVRAFTHFRFPRLVDRGVLVSDKVVELFRVSHYLDLRETEQDEPTEVWCCPDFAGDLSIDTVYRSKDEVLLGHVSVTRAYSRTWLGHQLTTLKGHPESAACRKALYTHFASVPTIMDGRDDVYLLGYYDRELRWHQLFFEAFVDWVGDESLVTVVPFDRFEPAETDAPLPALDTGEVEIEEARSEADIAQAVELIRDQLPHLAAEAFDINEESLAAGFLHPEYERRNVERGRKVLVAREGGELVGAALCETGSSNLSLFNLFNLAQVYTTEQASRSVHAALFRAAREFYSQRGIHDPVLVAPPRRFTCPGDAGLRLDETMGCIIWSGQTLEQYQSYVHYCLEKVGTASLTKAG